MSARRGNGNAKGKQVFEGNGQELTRGVADINVGSGEGNGGWEEVGKKGKNRAKSTAANGAHKSNTKAWTQPGVQNVNVWNGNAASQAGNSRKPAGRGNTWPQSNRVPQHVVAPPLQTGWNWKSVAGNSVPAAPPAVVDSDESLGLDDDDDDDDDDDYFYSDDSDSSHLPLGNQKESKWFKAFFENLEKLTNKEINDPSREWHCPACKGGPGAIDWYQGMQPLIRHAETKGSKRVKLHRQFAQLLQAEIEIRGTSVIPAGEVFDKWIGLKDEEKDCKIIWPPMVLIMNTKHEKDDSDKWLGMGSVELFNCFSNYPARKARHSYGPQGHCGMSALIFEASAMGYYEAARLHRHFAEQGFGRDAWDHGPVLFRPGGKRQLYGFMPVKQELDKFNQHSDEKLKLKFELRSYQEMVLHPLRGINEDSQQVSYTKKKLAEKERHILALEETVRIVKEKLVQTQKQHRLLRDQTMTHFEESKEAMEIHEEFYQDMLSRTEN